MGEPERVMFKRRGGPKRPRYVEQAAVYEEADGSGEVTGLKPLTSDAGCIKVYVERVQVARVDAASLIELGLNKGAAWTAPLAGKVRAATAAYEAERAGLRMLAMRARSAGLIERGLRQRGHETDGIRAGVARLRARGFIDDRQYADGVVRSELGRKPAGRRLVEAKLRRDGVSAEIIREVLDEAFAERDADSDAMELARRQAGGLRRLERAVAERRLMGRLARRGFDAEVVRRCTRQALDEVFAEEGES